MHAALGRAGMEQQQQPQQQPPQQQQATGSSGSRECSGGHEDVRKCGYLRKHKSSHRRFFVLRGASDAGGPARLEYYDSEKKFRGGAAPPRRSVSLAACLGIIRRADAKHKHLLTLYAKDECLAMAADSEEQQAEWYAALTELHDECCRAPHGAAGGGGGCGAAAGGGGAGGGIFGAASDAGGGGGGGDSGEDAGPAGCAGGSYGTMPATPVFKEVWQVNLKPKGLGQTRNLTGVFRLCLGTRTISFVKLNADAAAVNLQLMNIRRCGHSESFFFIEVGRSAVTGPGEFWMQVEDCVVAQNMHETILEAMRAMSEEFRPRSKSQTSGGAGGAAGAAGGGPHRRQQRYQPPPSQTGLNRRSRAESVAGASPVSGGGVTPQGSGFCASQLRNRASSEGDGAPGAPRSESADAISARLLLLQGEDAEGRLQSSQLVCAGRRQQQHHQHHQHHQQQQQHGQVIASYQRHQSRMQQQQGHLHHHQQQQQLHHAAATLLPGRSVSAPIARSPPAGGCSPSSLLLFSASSLITSPVSVSSSSGRGSVDAPCCVGSLGSTGGGGAGGGGVGGAAGHAAVGAGSCGAAALARGSRPSSASMSLGSLSDGGFVSSDEYGSSPCEPRGSATPDSPSPTPCAIREEEEEAAAAAAAAAARGGPYAYMQMGRARVYRAAPRGQDAPDAATTASTTSSTSPGFPPASSSSQSSAAAAVAAALASAEKGVVRKRTYSCASASAGPAMPPAALGPCLQQREQEKTASQEEYADGGGGDDEEDDDAGGGGDVQSRLVHSGDDGYMPMLPGVTASVAGRCRSGGDADYVPMVATGARDGNITAAAATTTSAAARGSLIQHQQRQRHHHHHHQQQQKQPWQRGQDGLCDAQPQDAASGYMVMSPGAGEGQAAGSIKTWPRPSVASGSGGGIVGSGDGVGAKAACERSVEARAGPPGAGDYMNMATSPANPAIVADTAAVPEGCYFSPMRDGEGAGGAGGGGGAAGSSSSSSFYSLPRSFRPVGQQSSRLAERAAATRPLGEVIREARDATPTPTSRPAALSRPREDASSSDPGREGGARMSGAPRRVGGAAAEGVTMRDAQGRWQGAPPEPRSPGEYVHIDCAAAAKAASQPVSSSSAWRPPQHAAGPQQGKGPDGCRAAHRGPPYLALSSGGAAAASAAAAQTRGDRRRRSANEYVSVAAAARAGGPPASVPAGPRPAAHPGPWDAASAGRGAPVGGDYTEMSRRGEASEEEEEAAGRRRRDATGGYSAPTASYRAPHGSYNLQHHHHGNHNHIHHYQLLQEQQHKPLPLPQQQQHQQYHQQEHHHQHPQQQHQSHAGVRPGYAALKPCVPPRIGLAFQPYAAGSGAVVIPATTGATAAPPPPPPPPPPPAAPRRQSAFSVVPPAAAQHGATRPGTAATTDEEERPRGGVARVAVALSSAATPQRPGAAGGHHSAGPVREAAGSHSLHQQHHQQQHQQQQLESGLNYIALDLRGEEGSAGSRGSVSSVDSNGYATIDFSRSESAG
ncbi:uncharacterized protein LOC144948816 [Lampetra fluviatilis]